MTSWWRRRPAPETLVCDGVFAVDLPPGWAWHGEPGEHYEITPGPGGPDVAVRLTVSTLDDALLHQGPVEVLRWFAGADHREPTAFSATSAPVTVGERAYGRWTVEDRAWFGGVLFLPGGLVIGSSNSAYGDSAAYRLGEQLVAAIRPL